MSNRLDLAIEPASGVAPDEQLLAALRRAIAFGDLAAGEQVPSIRKLVRQTGVSAAVIRRVYNMLIKEGLLVCKQGAGTYVSEKPFIHAGWFETSDIHVLPNTRCAQSSLKASPNADRADEETPTRLARQLVSVSEQLKSKATHEDTRSDIDLSGLSGDIDEVLQGIWDRQFKKASLALQDVSFSSSDPSGFLALRERIASWLLPSCGIECDADQIVILPSPHQARNLAARMLVDRGTRVGIEDPCDPDVRLIYLAYGANLDGIAVDESGMIAPAAKEEDSTVPANLSFVTEADSAVNADRALLPMLLHVSSSVQVPTGAVLSLSRRHDLIEYAKTTGAFIVEEAQLDDFNYETRALPSLRSIAMQRNMERIFYIGSFHETFPPAFRVGFLVIPQAIRELALHMRLMSGRFTSSVIQTNVLQLSQESSFHQSTKRMHRRLAEKRALLLETLNKWPNHFASFTPAKSGIHQTIWFNHPINDTVVEELCRYEGVSITPLSRFYSSPSSARPGIRVNFATVPPMQMIEGLNCIKDVLARLYDS